MRSYCEFGHALTPDNVQRRRNDRHCIACRQHEPTGARSALQLALAAYLAAPKARRDDMLVRDLVNVLVVEARAPSCTFVVDHRICGATGRLVDDRPLCDEHAAEVAQARKRQGRDDPR